jgi:hypothetical protein
VRALGTVVIATLVALGCEPRPVHEVLTLTDLGPRQLEPGELLRMTTTGLPHPGDVRRVTLELRGNLHRPGRAPCAHPVTVTLQDPPEDAQVLDAQGSLRPVTYAEQAGHQLRIEGPTRLEFVTTDGFLRDLATCPGERAPAPELTHATLRVSGSRAGITLYVETLQGAVLTVTRPLRGPVLELHLHREEPMALDLAARAEADRALAFLGLQLASAQPTEGGLQVEHVRPGSPADEAGLFDGDVLERIDGVTVLDARDLRPARGARTATFAVRRGEITDDHVVQIDRLGRVLPSDLAASGVLLAVAAVLVGLLLTPHAGPWTWFRRRLGRGLGLPDAHPRALLHRVLPWELGCLAAGTAAAALPLGPLVVGRAPDALAAAWVLLAGRCTMGLLRGRTEGPRGSWTAALARGADAAWSQLPALLAVAGVVVSCGAVQLNTAVDAQGGAPWAWNLLRNPVTAVLGVAFLASLGTTVAPGVGAPSRWRRGLPSPWGAVDLALTAALSALGAALFLGGWALPGVGPSELEGSAALTMLGAGLWVLKAWVLGLTARALRGALEDVRSESLASFHARTVAPWTLLAVALLAVWAMLGRRVPAGVSAVGEEALAWATFLVGLLWGAWALARLVVPALRRPEAYVPDPWR